MDNENLRLLIQNGESPTLELKIAPPRPAELAERLCGFANSALGGTLIIGVEDGSLAIRGVQPAGPAIDTILQAARLCKPVVPLVPAQPQVAELDGKKLVIAHVPPNNGELYQAGNVFWLRRGTHTVGMEKRELLDFVYRQGILSWETQPAPLATLDDLDMARVRAFLERRSGRASRGADPLQSLLTLKCAVREDGTGTVRPTNAGLVLFGYAPQNFFTQAEIVLTYFQDNLGARRYTDRKILGGTLAEQIDQAEEYLRLRLPVAARTEGFHRVDEPDLPLEALREAVVNAVVHRDYSIEGTAVRVFIYPDRVEVHNPGLLLPGVSLEELKRGQALSRPRNPVLASVLRELPGGYMERLGSGIRFMLEQMRALGLPEPEFKEQGEFVVTFRRAGVLNQPAAPVSAQPEVAAPAPVGQAARHELALAFLHRHGAITNRQYRQLTGVGETTAIRDLEALVEQGSIRAAGQGRGRHYVL